MKSKMDLQAEGAVVASLLLNNKRIPEVAEILEVEDFLGERTEACYRAILSLYGTEGHVDESTLVKHLENSSVVVKLGHIAEMLDSVPSSGAVLFHAKKVKELSLARKVSELSQELAEATEGDLTKLQDKIADTHRQLAELGVGAGGENSDMEHIFEEFEGERAEYAEKRKAGGTLIGHSCGFDKIDEVIDGLRKGHLWIVGGYTSSGKTTFALNIAKNLMDSGIKTAFISLEMSKVDIVRKMLGLFMHKGPAYITKADFDERDEESYKEAKKRLIESGAKVHTKSNRLNDILLLMMAEKLKGGADVFVIDYAQLINVAGKNEYEAMTEMATQVQAFAQKYNITVILLSQISNESARNQSSGVIGLKGSGALAASADIVIELVSAEESEEDRLEKSAEGRPIRIDARIKKNRHGRIGHVELEFFTKYGLLREYDDTQEKLLDEKFDNF